MGFKETLIENWEHRTMEYQGKNMWIAKQFEYKDKIYLYAVDESTFEKDEIEVAFLYKVKDDIFAYVKEEELFNELLGQVGGLLAKEQILRIRKEFDL